MINQDFLHDVAVYINTRINKVVINGSYVITNFRVKQVSGSSVALNYIVPAASVSLITLIELKDAADKILSSNNVNIPITTDHLMLQTIEVREVTS